MLRLGSTLVGSRGWRGDEGGSDCKRNRNELGRRPDRILCGSRSDRLRLRPRFRSRLRGRPRSLPSLCDHLRLGFDSCLRSRFGSRRLSRPRSRRNDCPCPRPRESRGIHEDTRDDGGGRGGGEGVKVALRVSTLPSPHLIEPDRSPDIAAAGYMRR
jgi:hypothetical protein